VPGGLGFSVPVKFRLFINTLIEEFRHELRDNEALRQTQGERIFMETPLNQPDAGGHAPSAAEVGGVAAVRKKT
jgi:hypothetical protein